MARKNTQPVRIDNELKKLIDEVAKKNDMSFSKASFNVAKTLKQFKMRDKKVFVEIKF